MKAVCNGRDDPVATATVAFAFFLTGLGVFIYTELIHPLVMWSLVQVEHLVVYALHLVGFLLYGPQNYVLSRLRRRLRHKRHVKIAMTWFEGPYRTAVRRVQRYWRARQMRKRAAYLLERIEHQKDAFEARKAYQLARKHLDDLNAAATMKRRLEERHDRAEIKALEAFQQRQSIGPVRAKRALDGCKCGKIPQLIRLEGERITFGATFDNKKAMVPLSITASRIRSVPLYDVRRPRTVEFKVKSIYRVCGLRNHKKYKLVCDHARDAELLVGALRALTRPKLKASQSVRDVRLVERTAEVDEELLAPEKPFGFLAASVTEFGPARPEAFRSVVVASSVHELVEEEW